MRLPIISNLLERSKAESLLALDLGTHSVKVSVFSIHPETYTIETHAKTEQKQGQSVMAGGQILDFDAVLETVTLALENLILASSLKPTSVILGTSGGVVESVGMTVRVKRPEPEKELSSKQLELLLKSIPEKTIPKAKEKFSNPNDYELVETVLTTYFLDNQRVTTPLGLTGATLEMHLMHTFSLRSTLNSLQRITKALGLNLLSLGETSVRIAHTLLAKNDSGVLIDIGGQSTELVLFKNGKIIANKFFHLGGHHLTHALAETLNLSFEQAEKMKLDFTEGILDSERARVVRRIITNGIELWVKGLEVALGEFKILRPLPSLFLVTGFGSTPEEIKAILITHPWNKILPFNNFPKIEHLKLDPCLALAQSYLEQHYKK